jgi:hypothetical protein
VIDENRSVRRTNNDGRVEGAIVRVVCICGRGRGGGCRVGEGCVALVVLSWRDAAQRTEAVAVTEAPKDRQVNAVQVKGTRLR